LASTSGISGAGAAQHRIERSSAVPSVPFYVLLQWYSNIDEARW